MNLQCFEIKVISKWHFQEHQAAAIFAGHCKSCCCSPLSSNQISCDPGGFPGNVCASPMASLHWIRRMDSTFLPFLPKNQGSQFCQLETAVKNQCQTPEVSLTARLEQGLRLGGSLACVSPVGLAIADPDQDAWPAGHVLARVQPLSTSSPRPFPARQLCSLSAPSLECLEWL